MHWHNYVLSFVCTWTTGTSALFGMKSQNVIDTRDRKGYKPDISEREAQNLRLGGGRFWQTPLDLWLGERKPTKFKPIWSIGIVYIRVSATSYLPFPMEEISSRLVEIVPACARFQSCKINVELLGFEISTICGWSFEEYYTRCLDDTSFFLTGPGRDITARILGRYRCVD